MHYKYPILVFILINLNYLKQKVKKIAIKRIFSNALNKMLGALVNCVESDKMLKSTFYFGNLEFIIALKGKKKYRLSQISRYFPRVYKIFLDLMRGIFEV